MTQIELARQLIAEVYLAHWAEWYKGHSEQKPAKLIITDSDSSSGYGASIDEIHLNLPESNLLEVLSQNGSFYDVRTPLGWDVWKRDLVHEMLHEYQTKIIKEVSAEGNALWEKKGRTFWGHGHDEYFFTAIVDISKLINVEPEILISNL